MKIDVNNITLNYTEVGKGYPLILLHGNGENIHVFDKLVDKLKQNFTVYAIDSRNHGESSQTDDFSYETMAQDIYCFIQKLDLKNVFVVGFSDGAIISLLLSIEHNNIFKKMALLGVNLKPSDFKKDIYDYIVYDYEVNKAPLRKMMLEQPNIELYMLRDINTPTLIVAAEDDLFTAVSFHRIVKAMPNAKLHIMKGHDHGSYIIDQDILYPDLLDFFNKGN